MTTDRGGSGSAHEDPIATLQRQIAALLATGNAADRVNEHQAAAWACARVQEALASDLAGQFDEMYRLNIQALYTLLCANVAAHASTELTPELRELYQTAIDAARAIKPEGIEEGRALRAYGAVLAYYRDLDTAASHLTRAFQFIAPSDDFFHDDELWALTAIQLAEVLTDRGMMDRAIEVLRQAMCLLESQSAIKTTHAEYVEAGILLAVLLWQQGRKNDSRAWGSLSILRAQELDPTRQNPLYEQAWQLRSRGIQAYARTWKDRERPLRI